MMPEQRLGEAIKQAEIVKEDHQLNARTQLDLLTAVHNLEIAKARYERKRETDGGAEVVE